MPRKGSRGSISKHGSTYRGVWYRNGARFCENLHACDETEARAKLAELIADCEQKNRVRPEKDPPSLGAMLDRVIRYYEYKERRSIKDVRRRVERLRKWFRGKRGDEVTRERIEKYVNSRRSEGAENGTINRELAALRLAYSLALKDGKIKPEMKPLFEMLPENNRRKGFFEPEEYENVLKNLPAYLHGPLTMGYWTGMRREEILSLEWSQVELASRLVHLEKTKNGEPRTLPLGGELMAMFERQWAGRDPDCPYVFHRGPLRIGDFRKRWYAACVAAGVGEWMAQGDGKKVYNGKIFHDLRRTGVRNMIRSGVPQSVAMAISGHKDASIFKRYDIVDGFDLAEAMRKREVYERELRVLRSHTFPEVEKPLAKAPMIQ
jgi:integrase